MGRINLAALRVRKTAISKYNAHKGRASDRGAIPNWVDIVRDIPPAQILVRQQPQQHPVTQVRTQLPPNSSEPQTVTTVVARPTTSHTASRKANSKKPSRLFAPVAIRYEEDGLRKQFFSDHPWELARPRVVLETTGNQWSDVDWSRGLKQPGVPLSGESVVQRQLWLLQNVPNMTVTESYDAVRREFYMLRRAEETRRRIAVEEAEHMGARFDKKALEWGMQAENKMYDEWEAWSRSQIVEQLQKNSAFGGESLPVEQEVLLENESADGNGESAGNASIRRVGDPFAAEAQRRSQYNYA